MQIENKMVSKLNNLEIGIDSSLSYCSITLFKKKKIIWDKGKNVNLDMKWFYLSF